MTARTIPAAAAVFAALMVGSTALPAPARAQDAPKEEPPPKFDVAYLTNPVNIKVGENVWHNQCRHCHGNAAYPGKAPKLNPGGMDPEFIYDRVTYGFRKMPSWKEVFTVEERKGVVAYIKSSEFSP
jgi:mono/diheme cytochrome c family protein